MEHAGVVDEYIGTSVSNQIVDVLAVDLFVQNINVVSLAILNLCNRFDQPLVLLNSLSITKRITIFDKTQDSLN